MNNHPVTIALRQALAVLFVLGAVLYTPTASADITTGLRSWYRFEGNATDSSGLAQHGTAQGNVQYGPGHSGPGIALDGATGLVDIGPDVYLDTVTASAWVRFDALPTSGNAMHLIDAWNVTENYHLSTRNVGGVVTFYCGFHKRPNTSQMYPEVHCDSTTHPIAGTFYHVATTFDGQTLRLFVNGQMENSITVSGSPYSGPTSNPNVRIGANRDELDHFNGMIDEVRIYDRALSDADIGQLHTWTPTASSGNSHTAQLIAAQSQYFSAPDSASLSVTGSLTLEAWVKRSSTADETIISKARESSEKSYQLYLDGGRPKALLSGSGADEIWKTGTTPLPPGVWHHLAAVYAAGGQSLKLYVNGVEDPGTLNGTVPAALRDSTSSLFIGASNSAVTPGSHFTGSIDEVRIWSVPRSVEQIRATMFQQLTGGEFGLRGYWRLNDSLADSSPNGNTLTTQGGAGFATNDLPFFNSERPLGPCADSDTAALWQFEGNSNDSSPNAIHGVGTMVQYFSSHGQLGRAVRLTNSDGGLVAASSYIRAELPNPDGGDFTLAAWVNCQNLGTELQTIVHREESGATGRPSWSLNLTNASVGFACVQAGSEQAVGAPISLTSNKWHHLVATRQGGEYRIYVNGIQAGANTYASPSVCSPTSPGYIGRRLNTTYVGTEYPLNGALDEIVILKRSLTPEEIMKYYGGIVSVRFTPLSGDGYVENYGSPFSTVRGALTGASADSRATNPHFGYALQGGVYSIRRFFYPVDTSALPDAGISLLRATFNVYNSGTVSNADLDSIAVVKTNQESTTDLTASDFSKTESVVGGVQPLSQIIGGQYNRLSLNSTGLGWINKSGVTKLGLRYLRDIENEAPTGLNQWPNVNFSENSSGKPYILMEYAGFSANEFSIAGTVSSVNPPPGPIRIMARSTGLGGTATSEIEGVGAYFLSDLVAGQSYTIWAYGDANNNDSFDPLEWIGWYLGNPLIFESKISGIDITLAPGGDTDGDGMNDAWELANGLNVGLNDAGLDKDADGLTNLQEFSLFGPGALSANDDDSDKDGVKDGLEFNTHGTNPQLTDSDGDGMPDAWEVAHGLDPRRDDRNEDWESDFVTNAQEFAAGTNPASADTDGNGIPDYQQRNGGKTTWQALYDRNDRLLGIRHERGASFAYAYDGNSNITRQIKLGRDSDSDGLPDLWEFTQGLDPYSSIGVNGPNGDPDSDGWTNFQEQIAGSDPKSAASKPGANGLIVGSITVPFTPTKFVAASGQLDNAGTEEIVVGADGNPEAQTNFIRIYRNTGAGWTNDPIDQVLVGNYGVTSIAAGQVGTRPPSIYLGLWKPGGNGRVIELLKNGTTWQTTVVAESLTDVAHVHGIRNTSSGTDLMIGLAARFGSDGGLYRAAHEDGTWKVNLLNEKPSHRRTGTIARMNEVMSLDRVVRLSDDGGIQVTGKRTYPTLDEFGDTVLTQPFWTFAGSAQNGGTWSVREEDGFGKVEANWQGNNSSQAEAWMEADISWISQIDAVEIRIGSAGHFQTRGPAGNALVKLGGTELYSSGTIHTDQNILIQILRNQSTLLFRRRVDSAVWSDWIAIPPATRLRFNAFGDDGPNERAGNAWLHIDYVRHQGLDELLSAGASLNDSSGSEIAYRAEKNTLYFKTPSAQSWLDSHYMAVARGGNLVAIDSASINSWLQGKFSGDFWAGFYRDFATSPWTWVSNSSASFAPLPWAAGQPGVGSDQLFAFSNNGNWSSGTGNEAKPAVFEVKQPLVEVSTVVEPEPAATHRLHWDGQTFTTGRFNAAIATQTSVIEAFIDDKDTSNSVTSGDEFVIAELVLGTSPAVTRTLVRRTLDASAMAPGYGLAATRTRSGTSDFLVTGENDGVVAAWLPSSEGGALVRKTLSVEHVGKAWHSMARVAMGYGTDGIAGVRVDPVIPQTADLVFWSPYDLGFSAPPIIQQSPPSARIAATPASGIMHAQVGVRLWDSEGNPARVVLQFQNPPGTGAWTSATLVTIDGQPAPTNPALSAPPTGATHQLVWNAGNDLGGLFAGTVMLRAQASDRESGPWSEPMPYSVDATADRDTDGDGFSEFAEAAFGTDPNAATSRPVLTLAKNADGSLTFTWPAAAGRNYILESSPDLAAPWSPIQTIAAGTLTLTPPGGAGAPRKLFYRVRAE